MNEQQIRQIASETAEKILKERARVFQADIVPLSVKNRHIDGVIIQFGLAAARPANGGAVGVRAWFSTDTGVLSLWTGSAWLTETFT